MTVTKNDAFYANFLPNGTHITNKSQIETTVAKGTTCQLSAVTTAGVTTLVGVAGAILFPMDDITNFLYLIGSVFAPMIAVQIADHFLLRRDRFAVAADARNLVIWLIGFVAYRLLMGVDTPVGYTLPDMALTVVLCVIAEKVKPTARQS